MKEIDGTNKCEDTIEYVLLYFYITQIITGFTKSETKVNSFRSVIITVGS